MKPSSHPTVSRSKRSKRNTRKLTLKKVAPTSASGSAKKPLHRSNQTKQKHHSLSFASILVTLVFVVVLFFGVRTYITPPIQDISSDTTPITLVFVGDIMMDRGVKRSIEKYFKGDYHALFTHTDYIKKADIAFANLEGPVATGGRKVGSIYSFRMNPSALTALRDAGVDVVSFANNHIGDYSQVAFDESLKHLQENNILSAGAGSDYTDATTSRIIMVRGMKVGFLAATDVGPTWMKATAKNSGVVLATDPKLPTIIAEAKKSVDVLVMSFHFGDEYSPSNARQKTLAHMAVDNGADIVIGSHPHVMQKMETYKDKPIFYSLGNFIFDQPFSIHTMHGMVATVSIDPTTKVITATEQVSPLSNRFIPQPLVPFNESMVVKKTFTP